MYAVRTQLSWTQQRSLMGQKNALERQFYMQMCALEHWDTRTLDAKIDQQLYQRTAISQKPEDIIRLELEQTASGSRRIGAVDSLLQQCPNEQQMQNGGIMRECLA